MTEKVYTIDEISPECGLRGICISGRELYESLGHSSGYSSWIDRKVSKLDLEEAKDYVLLKNTETGGRPSLDHIITLDAAKLIAACDNSEKGLETLKEMISKEKKQSEALLLLSNISYKHPEGLVFSQEGRLYTTSLILAEVSGKSHKNVLRDIRAEMANISPGSHLSPAGVARILSGFQEMSYKGADGGIRKCYYLSEEAFLQMSLRYSAQIRGKFILAFVDYRNALLNIQKARVLETSLPQIKSSRSFVYLIQGVSTGMLKIGVSNNPELRVKQMQTGSPDELVLVYTSLVCSNAFAIEAEVHEHFAEYRDKGEWFNSDLKVSDVIQFLESRQFVLNSDFDLSFDSQIVKLLESPDEL